MDAFEQLAPFIKDYIYRNKWNEMRQIQVAACDIIFNSKNNLLLASGTASGKTEAAFLPILTQLYNNPSSSVGVLYISPLKSLINDQFERLQEMLDEVDIPVTKWHGDVDYNKKRKLVDCPQGILQITPESLESMLVHRKEDIPKLFGDLRYIVIDEVHHFMANERGLQLLSILQRIERLANCKPVRVGLSATLGDYCSAGQWLNSDKTQKCIVPDVSNTRKRFRLRVEYFDFRDDADGGEKYYEYIFRTTLGKKSIIFANSRYQTEYTIAMLKQMAKSKNMDDIYRIHHGSISASLREQTEREMKNSDRELVTGATVTLELGVDIGRLDRVVQLQAPYSVSSFLQRLGRCGRRENPAEMFFVFGRDGKKSDDTVIEMDWNFILCVAILQVYIEEQWIEAGYVPKLPFSLLFHQTMSYIASMGEVSVPYLAQYILTLYPFCNVSQEQYRKLLRYMLDTDMLEKTEQGGVIIGIKGERVVNHRNFCAVFISQVEYTVKYENKTIGTVESLYPVNWLFELGGQSWKVVENCEKSKMIFVVPIGGISENFWKSPTLCNRETKIIKKAKSILNGKDNYSYLSEQAMNHLNEYRVMYKQCGLVKDNLIHSSDGSKIRYFPWVGTKEMQALKYALRKKKIECEINVPGIWIDIKTKLDKQSVAEIIKQIVHYKEIDFEDFDELIDENVLGKYNEFIPEELLKEQFFVDGIDFTNLCKYIEI